MFNTWSIWLGRAQWCSIFFEWVMWVMASPWLEIDEVKRQTFGGVALDQVEDI